MGTQQSCISWSGGTTQFTPPRDNTQFVQFSSIHTHQSSVTCTTVWYTKLWRQLCAVWTYKSHRDVTVSPSRVRHKQRLQHTATSHNAMMTMLTCALLLCLSAVATTQVGCRLQVTLVTSLCTCSLSSCQLHLAHIQKPSAADFCVECTGFSVKHDFCGTTVPLYVPYMHLHVKIYNGVLVAVTALNFRLTSLATWTQSSSPCSIAWATSKTQTSY